MGKYLLKRLGQSIIAILGITVVVFFILHLTGNPVELNTIMAAMVNRNIDTDLMECFTASELQIESTEMEILSEEMGFNDPLPVQYVRFLKGALVGDFGTSYYYNEPAMSVVLERAPATLTLACAALLISVVLGIPAGIVAAVKRNSVSDAVIRVLALLGQCMPAFWLGIMLIMLFAVKLGWMPTGGAEDGLRSLILPAFTLGVFSAATICRLLRSNLIEVLGKEYIDVAKAKGLPKSKIIGKHALKNAMSSIITILGMQFASLLGGSVITEQVFAWPGVGRLVIQSITTSDFAVVECIVFLMAVIFVVINFIVDVLYCVINPRVRLQ